VKDHYNYVGLCKKEKESLFWMILTRLQGIDRKHCLRGLEHLAEGCPKKGFNKRSNIEKKKERM